MYRVKILPVRGYDVYSEFMCISHESGHCKIKKLVVSAAIDQVLQSLAGLSVRSEGVPREGRRGDGHNTAQSHWSGSRVPFTPRHTHHTRNHLIVELHLGTLHSLAGEQGVI